MRKTNSIPLRAAIAALACAAALAAGCAGQIRVEPIQPYVDPGIRSYSIRTVAVVPFVIPEYLGTLDGGNQVSVRMTNDLIRHLNGMASYHIISPVTVRDTIVEGIGPVNKWIYEGSLEQALAVAQQLQCDGVIYSRLTSYRQGNLIDSEVEVETSLIDTFSATTVWSIRENVRGKAGDEKLNQPVRAPSAELLSEQAVANVAKKIELVNRDGENVEVTYVSPRRVAGFTLLGVGVASTAVTAYSYYEGRARVLGIRGHHQRFEGAGPQGPHRRLRHDDLGVRRPVRRDAGNRDLPAAHRQPVLGRRGVRGRRVGCAGVAGLAAGRRRRDASGPILGGARR